MQQRERPSPGYMCGDTLASPQGMEAPSGQVPPAPVRSQGLAGTGQGGARAGTRPVVVVGGANMDIGGISAAPLVPADSNPGTVHISLGGVGRNIAHDLALLGVQTHLLTALGEDAAAHTLRASCAELGIDASHALHVAGGTTSVYLFIANERGEMALALSDMEIYRYLTPAYMARQASLLRRAGAVVVDTNIPAETIAWLAENCQAPLFADPVSTAKAEKLRPVLGRLHTLKPNRIEAELLSGVRITDAASLHRAADALLATGLQRVFISLGADGVLAADATHRYRLPCAPGNQVDSTGCGDAFMAALVWAHMQGQGLLAAAQAGLVAAAVALESDATISPALSQTELIARAAAFAAGTDENDSIK